MKSIQMTFNTNIVLPSAYAYVEAFASSATIKVEMIRDVNRPIKYRLLTLDGGRIRNINEGTPLQVQSLIDDIYTAGVVVAPQLDPRLTAVIEHLTQIRADHRTINDRLLSLGNGDQYAIGQCVLDLRGICDHLTHLENGYDLLVDEIK